jgi:hypothetical protein
VLRFLKVLHDVPGQPFSCGWSNRVPSNREGLSEKGWSGTSVVGANGFPQIGHLAVKKDKATLKHATPQTVKINVSKKGSGGGEITGDPPGISYGETCSGPFLPGATLTLTAALSITIRQAIYRPTPDCAFGASTVTQKKLTISFPRPSTRSSPMMKRKVMATSVDAKEVVPFEELLMSETASLEALVRHS